MNTKLDYYRIFLEVANTLSFSDAAKKLFISQSAVSQTIKQLESDLNTTLFQRYAKGVILTKEGTLLKQYAQDALATLSIAEKKLIDMKEMEEGTLSIGAGDTISSNYLIPYLESFHAMYPKIKIEVYNRTSLEMVDLVKSGIVDLAFINLPLSDKELTIQPCFVIHDIFVCAKNKTLKASYTRQEIANMPLILLEKNANSRKFIDHQFKKSHITLNAQIELGAHDLLLQFAKIDLGVSCVIKEFATDYLNRKLIQEIPMQEPLPKRAIAYTHLKRMPLSNAAQSFLAFVEQKNK